MPLLTLPAKEAIARMTPASRWPDEQEAQMIRLAPLARPAFTEGFKFGKNDLIFTIGSCFARNIEKQLLIEGYNVAIERFHPPLDPNAPGDMDAVLHRYVPQSIANDLHWGLSGEPFPEDCYVEVSPGAWCDLQLNTMVPPGPRELVAGRRKAILDYMRSAGEARLVIITVGLAEAWFDRATGLYLNAMPHSRARKLHKDRFEFHLLDYDDVLAGLERISGILAAHCRADHQILITVSPVALSRTFTGDDVLVANAYMKSVLRAAVEAFVRAHENVTYFPSYESVIMSDRARAWRDDQAHVSDELVRLNVLRMTEAYATDPGDVSERLAAMRAYDHLEKAQAAYDWAAWDQADEAYRAALATAPSDPHVLLEYGKFLVRRRRWDDAVPILEASLEHGSAAYGGYLRLAQAHMGGARYPEARQAAARAREFQPSNITALDIGATAARKLKLADEALSLAELHFQFCPESEDSRRRVEDLRRFSASKSPTSPSILTNLGLNLPRK